MRSIVTILLSFLVLEGCASSRATRVQKPFIAINRPATVALVTFTVPPSVLERVTSDLAPSLRQTALGALQNALVGTPLTLVDKTDLGFTLRITADIPEPTRLELLAGERKPQHDLVYGAEPPIDLPVGVTQDLVLGMYVLEWRRGVHNVGTDKEPVWIERAEVDVVYSLWTRDGREVETRRVVVQQRANTPVFEGMALLPSAGHDAFMSHDVELDGLRGPFFADETFQFAADLQARLFAWPFRAHELREYWEWDDTHDGVKPGVELAMKGELDSALASWVALVDREPAAMFNTAVVHEIRGDDAAALALYKKAQGLRSQTPLYDQALRNMQARLALQRAVELSP